MINRYKSHYKLSEVIQKINGGKFLVRPDVIRDAFQIFGWEIADIKKTYKKLKPKHFYKTDNLNSKPGVSVDIYKAHLFGEDIYTHFYIDETTNLLIINSFHEI